MINKKLAKVINKFYHKLFKIKNSVNIYMIIIVDLLFLR